eukprot:383543-Pelagomonas_calceolata.AAC.1
MHSFVWPTANPSCDTCQRGNLDTLPGALQRRPDPWHPLMQAQPTHLDMAFEAGDVSLHVLRQQLLQERALGLQLHFMPGRMLRRHDQQCHL